MKFIFKLVLSVIFCFYFLNLHSGDTPKNLIIKKLKDGNENSEVTENMDFISVNYTGWLFNPDLNTKEYCDAKGKMFDSNEEEKFNHKIPFQFVLGKGIVIKGWDSGLQKMRINEKRCLVIPPKFAYGNRRIGDIIKPNSTLIFEVKLLKILKSKK